MKNIYIIVKLKSLLFSLIGFILSVIIFWILWFFKAYTWLIYSDRLANILYLFQIINIIFMLVIGAGILCKVIDYKSNSSRRHRMTYPLYIIIIICHLGFLFTYGGYGHTVMGLTNIVSKSSFENKYYIVIKDLKTNKSIELECNSIDYDKLLVNDKIYYSFEYRTLAFMMYKGHLGYIDTKNYIDNR